MFVVLFLDMCNWIVVYEELFFGIIDVVVVYFCEVVCCVLFYNVVVVIVVYNYLFGYVEFFLAD